MTIFRGNGVAEQSDRDPPRILDRMLVAEEGMSALGSQEEEGFFIPDVLNPRDPCFLPATALIFGKVNFIFFE